jgi:hypothetical protein
MTRIVYCKNSNRSGSHKHTSFTFRACKARNRYRTDSASFLPAISNDALTKISRTVCSWRLHQQTGHGLTGLARAINPVVRGWRSTTARATARYCIPSAKHQRLPDRGGSARNTKRLRWFKKTRKCWEGITIRYPHLSVHWRWTPRLLGAGMIRAG